MRNITKENDYIDLLKLQQRRFCLKDGIDSDNIRNSVINSGGLLIGELALTASDLPIYSTAILHFILFYIGGRNICNNLLQRVSDQDIINIIENSEFYNEYRELYENYIEELVMFLESINITDSLDISKFFGIFINRGYFSSDCKYEWKSYKYSKDAFIPKLMGSYIMTGAGVCRHAASMLTDILNEAGFQTCNLCVLRYKEIESLKEDIQTKQTSIPSYLVTGIIDNEEKYVYDPTSQSYGVFDYSEATKLNIDINSFVVVEDGREYYSIMSHIPLFYNSFNRKDEISFEDFSRYNSRIIDEETIRNSWDNLIENIKKHSNELSDFREEHVNDLQKIKKLSKIIAPYSDKRITEWKIK